MSTNYSGLVCYVSSLHARHHVRCVHKQTTDICVGTVTVTCGNVQTRADDVVEAKISRPRSQPSRPRSGPSRPRPRSQPSRPRPWSGPLRPRPWSRQGPGPQILRPRSLSMVSEEIKICSTFNRIGNKLSFDCFCLDIHCLLFTYY